MMTNDIKNVSQTVEKNKEHNFEEGVLNCQVSGYIPEDRSRTICSGSVWSPPLSSMACVETVTLIVGGLDSNDYAKHVEVLK